LIQDVIVIKHLYILLKKNEHRSANKISLYKIFYTHFIYTYILHTLFRNKNYVEKSILKYLQNGFPRIRNFIYVNINCVYLLLLCYRKQSYFSDAARICYIKQIKCTLQIENFLVSWNFFFHFKYKAYNNNIYLCLLQKMML